MLLAKHNAADAGGCRSRQVPRRPIPTARRATSAWRARPVEDRYDAAAARTELSAALAVNPRARGRAGAAGRAGARRRGLRRRARRRGQPSAACNPRDRGAARVEADAGLAPAGRPRPGFGQARDQGRSRRSIPARRAVLRLRRGGALAPAPLRGRARRGRRRGCAGRSRTTPAACRRWEPPCSGSARRAPASETLRRAWKRDPYDLRTFNLLDLYEKVIPARLRHRRHGPPALPDRAASHARRHRSRSSALSWRRATAAYVARYGFEPHGPITFELYGRPAAVRGPGRRPPRRSACRGSASGA